MSETIRLEKNAPLSSRGMRLDQVASDIFSDFSRSRLQSWIKKGKLLVGTCVDMQLLMNKTKLKL